MSPVELDHVVNILVKSFGFSLSRTDLVDERGIPGMLVSVTITYMVLRAVTTPVPTVRVGARGLCAGVVKKVINQIRAILLAGCIA